MNKSVLIADDSLFMRTWLKSILTAHNYEIFEAADGAEAIAAYALYKPSLVLMDITMNKLNGLEALKKIIEFDPSAKVVMCSSLGQKQLIIEALKLGAKDFIVKPYFDQLIPILDNIE
ncbi:chemotaxis protein CheY [Bacillus sp. FJAT-27231]|uniref:response regulator n=1 Tax=Bacillus sp. FJAT-27231 TaxID=1679168 RepID=UPI0006709578|nr:response regulator [Bacillus sp. FJAT-27231]KMY54516.1 chemotaxis protein CheY [Bacillus sp. FJAT-27231]